MLGIYRKPESFLCGNTHDRLEYKHLRRFGQVFLDKHRSSRPCLASLLVAQPHPRSPTTEYDRPGRLGRCEERGRPEYSNTDQGDPRSPPPTDIAGQGITGDGAGGWSAKGSQTEESRRYAPLSRTGEEVHKHAAHNGQHRRARQRAEEPESEYDAQRVGRGAGDLEQGEQEKTSKHGPCLAVQLRGRAPDHGAEGEAQHVQSDAQEGDVVRDAKDALDVGQGSREDAAAEGYHEGGERVCCHDGPLAPGGPVHGVLRVLGPGPAGCVHYRRLHRWRCLLFYGNACVSFPPQTGGEF